MSTNEATALLNDSPLLKSDDGHKYVKREGMPGAYKYTYADGSTGHTEHKPTFQLGAAAHQQGLFGASSYEKKPAKPKAPDPLAHRQVDMFAPKPAAATAPAPAPAPEPASKFDEVVSAAYTQRAREAGAASAHAREMDQAGYHGGISNAHRHAASAHRRAGEAAIALGHGANTAMHGKQMAHHEKQADLDDDIAARHAATRSGAAKEASDRVMAIADKAKKTTMVDTPAGPRESTPGGLKWYGDKPHNPEALAAAREAYGSAKSEGRSDKLAHSKASKAAQKHLGGVTGAWDHATHAQELHDHANGNRHEIPGGADRAGPPPRAPAKKKSPKAQATHAAKVADAASAKENAADHAHDMGSKATTLSTAAHRLSNAGGDMGSANHQAAHEAHKAAAAANREAASAFQQPGASVSIAGKSFSSLHEERAKAHDEKAGDHWREAVKARSDEEGEPFSQAATHKVDGTKKTDLDKLHEGVADLKPSAMRSDGHFTRAADKFKALRDHIHEKVGAHPAHAHASKAFTLANTAAQSSGSYDVKTRREHMEGAQQHAQKAIDAMKGMGKSMDHEVGISRFQDRSAGRPAAGGVYDGLGSGMVDPTVDRPRYAGRAPNQVIAVGVAGDSNDRNTFAYQKGRQSGATLDLAKSAMIGAVKDGYRMQLIAVADANPVASLIMRGRVEGERPMVPAELRKSVQLSAPDPDAVVAFAAAALKAASDRNPQLREGLSRLGVSRATLYATLEALALTPAGMTAGNR
jgi:hypothetical protein